MTEQFITDFVNKFDNKGTLLDFTLAGFGGTLASIVNVPGCSRILHACRLLYSEQSVSDWTNRINDDIKSVSVDMLEHLTFITDMNVQYIMGTASLTTNRWRKGDNQCFVRFRGPIANLDASFKFTKLSEEKYNAIMNETLGIEVINKIRQMEDSIIAHNILLILQSPNRLDGDPIVIEINPNYKITISKIG